MTRRVAYFDLASGAGGDMLIAALVHAGRSAGVDVETAVTAAVEQLGLNCSIAFSSVDRGGLAGLHAAVTTDGASHTHTEMVDAIKRTDASDDTKQKASDVIRLLVAAEAVVHGVDEATVHLHEVGSADTAADAIGAAVALDALRVVELAAPSVPMPKGWIPSAHGALPLPAPATLEILKGAPIVGVDHDRELVTPTAAAVLVAHGCRFGTMPAMVLQASGTGAGTALFDRPNICRVLLGERVETPVEIGVDQVVLLETNVDDQAPEAIAYAMESLRRSGALDAWITPTVMKKSRPAFQISAIARPGDEARVVETLFRETTTLGIRRREVSRWTLEREAVLVHVNGHEVRVKAARLRGEVVNVAPEYDDCAAVCERTGMAFKDVQAEATAQARHALTLLD